VLREPLITFTTSTHTTCDPCSLVSGSDQHEHCWQGAVTQLQHAMKRHGSYCSACLHAALPCMHSPVACTSAIATSRHPAHLLCCAACLL
jgi:hypothetical protein